MSGTVLVADTERAELVVFRLDGQRYALRLGAIERFVRALVQKPFTAELLGRKVREVLDAK